MVLFQTLDPGELELAIREPTIFRDLETGRELYVDPALAGRQYAERLAQHCAEIRQICDRQGIELHRLTTDRPLDLVLFDYLRGRLERGHKTRVRRVRA